jgi:hypothetical protein
MNTFYLIAGIWLTGAGFVWAFVACAAEGDDQ